jgi:hypothetical protein
LKRLRHNINLAMLSPAAFSVRHRLFTSSHCNQLRTAGAMPKGGVSVMAEKPRNTPNKAEDQPLVKPGFPMGTLRDFCANFAAALTTSSCA